MTIKPETLEFIYRHTVNAHDQQMESVSAIDSKVAHVFVASAIVIGLAATSIEVYSSDWTARFFIAAVVVFAGVGIVSLVQLRPRTLRQSSHADQLWPEHWDEEVNDIQHALVDDIADAYKKNKCILKEKAITLWCALVLCSLEVIFVGLALVVAVRGQALP